MRPGIILPLIVALLAPGCILLQDDAGPVLTVGSTTTTRDTGLLDALLAEFTNDTGVAARGVVGGTGEVVELARRGDVDVLLTHAPRREQALVDDGGALYRRDVMFNRFVLVGPEADPAGAAAAANATSAFVRILEARELFVSRGDRSGTHDKELEVWREAGVDPVALSGTPRYKETGSGQAATLRFANENDGYALADEGTWWTLRSAGAVPRLAVLVADDPTLRNPYSVLPVSNATQPGVRTDLAERFAEWVTSERGQAVIAAHEVDGRALFVPAASGGKE